MVTKRGHGEKGMEWLNVLTYILGLTFVWFVVDVSLYYIKKYRRKKKHDDGKSFIEWL